MDTYPSQHGLLYMTSNRIRGGGPRSAVDIYFDRENGKVTRFVVSSGVAAVPSPGCEHRFICRGLSVKADYGRSGLWPKRTSFVG